MPPVGEVDGGGEVLVGAVGVTSGCVRARHEVLREMRVLVAGREVDGCLPTLGVRSDPCSVGHEEVVTHVPRRAVEFDERSGCERGSETDDVGAGDRDAAERVGAGRECRENPLGDREACLLYTSPSPRDLSTSRMPSSA